MNPIRNFVKSPMVWILAAGVLVGVGATATVLGERKSPTLASSPLVSVDGPRPVGQIKTESMDMVRALDESFANLAEAVKPSVVHIRVKNSASRNQYGELQATGGEGSGVIFRSDGYIVTNDHVVGGFENVNVILYDGREFPGKVIRAEDSDIAVVKIEAKDLPALPFADSSSVRSGEFAMAIGAPFGLDNTVTVGHISATQRTNQIADPNTGKVRMYWDLVQTDAPINMGNSGGPLVNIEGQVVGINTAIFSPTGTSGGIGFAISSSQARLLAETLIEKGKVVRGYLGIALDPLKEIQKKDLRVEAGALVKDVPNEGPAAGSGIKPNDVVVRVGDLAVKNMVDVPNAMIKYGPGTKVDVEIIRDGQHKTFSVTAGEGKPMQSIRNNTPQVDPRKEFDFPEIPGFKDSPRTQNPEQVPFFGNGKPRMGVEVGSVDETARKTFGIPQGVTGAVINLVMPGFVGDRAGLKIGDVVTELGGKSIKSASDLATAVAALKSGDRRQIKFERYDKGSKVQYEREVIFQ